MRKAQAGCHFLQPAEDFLLFFSTCPVSLSFLAGGTTLLSLPYNSLPHALRFAHLFLKTHSILSQNHSYYFSNSYWHFSMLAHLNPVERYTASFPGRQKSSVKWSFSEEAQPANA
ncbi:hypothetical protein OZL92_15645 [Bacillus sonorensis]|uniref:hypothetical protein n=1 Tax=Bacillus TaxID=1386 RepID=UPI001140730B|nr:MULTISPECIES: hypothetical protein [Bacillus]MCF7620031.1 hypothetical protein [Bacillus sonorensis]MCY7857145.1 hypothetical protein [Bacillus sonorensis]MCY8027298.1 hypothetical protein [Bacillus sonorensis]MCY8086595.1 hypothetical protein [Bacillus sonorensis]MCY8270592.1 hypothetical protein [Bacillus sonorensis]